MIKKVFILGFLLFSGGLLSAQILDDKIPLRAVLDSVSLHFQINFNFADETIEGIFIIPPGKNISLDNLLADLARKSGLVFKMLGDQVISITPKPVRTIDICGYMLDIENLQPLSGASVMNDKRFSITDSEGYFELKDVSPGDTIVFYSLGYEIAQNSAAAFAADPCLEILMKPMITKLREVIISGFIVNGIDISSDGSIRIDTKKLGILPGLTDSDVLQTLQALPGIQSINESVSDINVRGGTNDQNLIYWDGIKMYQSGHFFGLISAFNPFITNNVTLIKNGTTSSLSDGVSSTILIETDDYVDQDFQGGAGINMINADMFLKMPLSNKLSLQLSGRRSIADIVKTPTYQQYFNRAFRNTEVTQSNDPGIDSLVDSNDQFNFYDITGKVLFDATPRDKIRVNFLGIYNIISYQESELVQGAPQTRTSSLEQSTLASGVRYRRIWNDYFTTNTQVYFTSYALGAINYDIGNNQRLTQENEILDTGLKLDGRLALNGQFDLNSGYQFNETGISNLTDINNPPYRRLLKRVLRSHAIFTEGNYSSGTEATNIRLGLRANYFEKFNRWILEPRLAFNQKFLENFSVELLGEMKSQTSSQIIDLQNDFLGVEKRRWILANEDDIPVATSQQASVGLRYQSGKFLASVEGYWKTVQGITSASQGFQNQFQYVRSTGSYDVSGVDILLNQKFDQFISWLSYSFANHNYEFDGFQPRVFPGNLDIRHIFTFGTSWQIDNFQLSGGFNWRTGNPFTPASGVNGNDIQYEEPNSSRLDNYLRADVSAKYLWKPGAGTSWEVGFSIWNIFNNNNIVNAFYQFDDAGQLTIIKESALEFTPNLFLRVKF